MRDKLEKLFIVVTILLLVFGFRPAGKTVFANEGGFTSAAGFSENNGEKEETEGIGNTAIFGGNVGIGTIAPQAKLHIAGIPGVDGLMFPDGTLQTTAAISGLSDTYWKVDNSVLYNTNDGNVGIGTTTPLSKLEVQGDIKATTVNGSDVVRTQSFQVFPAGDFSFTTEKTDYAPVSKYLKGGLRSQFLSPLRGTKRYYRLKVTYTDNITDSDNVVGSNLRYFEENDNTEIFNFVLEYSSASADWINQRISARFVYHGDAVTRMEVRSGVKNKFLQIYGIWIIAEDVLE